MRKHWLAVAAVVAAGSLVSTPVLAVTVPGTLDVNATVSGGCTVSTVAVSFGDYAGVQVDATGTINVNCTADLVYSVELGAGTGGGASRQMLKVGDPTAALPYELYPTAARTTPWGGADYAVGGAAALTGLTGLGANQGILVYGRIDAGEPLSAGSFADTVTVSVIY